MVFLTQLQFGLSNLLANLGARVHCRTPFLSWLYRPGEALPPPYTPRELADHGVA
jgi:hypothetical protein